MWQAVCSTARATVCGSATDDGALGGALEPAGEGRDWEDERVTAVVVLAGIVAGVIGTAGGITSLVSYPALLVAGATPLQANIVNLVALVACWPASAAVSRVELRAVRRYVPTAVASGAIGGAIGSLLLLHTDATVFNQVVPYLVLGGSVALMTQPWLSRRAGRARPWMGYVVTVLVAMYGGYFGAGSGVMLLVVCLMLFDDFLPHANALKNMVNGGVSVASAVVLIAAAPVRWDLAVPLAAGLFVGSLLGPLAVRRLPAFLVRWTVAALGVGLAVDLGVSARR